MLFENLSVDARKTLQAESKQKFEAIYDKTLAAFALTPDKAPCRHGFQKCWEDILALWDRCADDAAYYLLFSAMYHIAWNRHAITGKYTPLVELVTLIEQAILDEGYAYEVWSSTWVYLEAMAGMEKTTVPGHKNCNSDWFGKYIYTKACRKICLKDDEGRSPLYGEYFVDGNFLPCDAIARKYPASFEAAVTRLLPQAVGWTQADWSDESFIMGEIQKTHGVDYSRDPKSFDHLIDALYKQSNGRAYDISLMMVRELSVSMVSCIWPRNYKKSVECFLSRLCKQVRERELNPTGGRSFYTRGNLRNSWVIKQYAGGCWPMPNDLKRMIFDLSVCE